jgi:hypothetical protein
MKNPKILARETPLTRTLEKKKYGLTKKERDTVEKAYYGSYFLLALMFISLYLV